MWLSLEPRLIAKRRFEADWILANGVCRISWRWSIDSGCWFQVYRLFLWRGFLSKLPNYVALSIRIGVSAADTYVDDWLE